MAMGTFGNYAKRSSKTMPLLGILFRWYDYQDYVVKEDQADRIPTGWDEWSAEWIEKGPQIDATIEQTYKEIKARLDAEKADIYGGETPEETWSMFLEALKKEDFELASKYFVVDKQAEYLSLFNNVKEGGQYDAMMADLTVSELHMGTIYENSVEFSISGEDKKATSYGKILRIGDKWKINSI